MLSESLQETFLDDADQHELEDSAEQPIPPIEFEDLQVHGWPSSSATSVVNSPATVPSDEEDPGPDGFGPVHVLDDFVEPTEAVPSLAIETSTANKFNQAWVHQLRCSAVFPVSQLQYPWERYYKNQCVDLPFPVLRMPKMTAGISTLVSPEHSASSTSALPSSNSSHSQSSWWAVKSRIGSLDWKTELDHKRRLAFERCRVLLQLDPSSAALGRLILADIHTLASDDSIISSVTNVFANKATKTILKRSGAFQQFVVWCVNRKYTVYPVLESTAYAYLNDMAHKAPTFAASFKESLNFMHGALGVDGCKQSAESRRIIGLCVSRALNKKPRIQAPPLTTKQVEFMEHFVGSEFDLVDRCFVGHCLLCVYTRSRWEDLQHACEPKVDFVDNDGYYELSSLVTKTSANVAKKTTFLPMVAPVPGITTCPWLEQFLSLRKSLALPDFNKHEPSMPVVLTSGKFGSMPLSSSQAGEWIRLIFRTRGVDKQYSRVTSHSFKATLLSWAAKGGLSKEHRCTLGYHTIDSNQSMLHYSRDEQAAPLRALKRLLCLIKQGRFKPDNNRSGYYISEGALNAGMLQPTPKIMPGPSNNQGNDESTTSSSEGTSSDDAEGSNVMSDEERVAKQLDVPVRPKKRPKVDDQKPCAVHFRWRTVHAIDESSVNKLKCGRLLSSVYRVLPELPSFDYHRCIDCFGSHS